MNTQDFDNSKQEFEKVVGLLTPKYPRKNDFSFNAPRRSVARKIWAFVGIAAMLAIVVVVAVKTVIPVSAKEVINTALVNLSDAESVKIHFNLRAVKSDEEGVYIPNPYVEMLGGTVYILKKDGHTYNRIDWHDAEKNSIIFTGSDYIHLKNGIQIETHPSSFQDELINILNLKGLEKEKIINDSEIIESGNLITVTHNKKTITFTGEFRKDNRQLSRASVVATAPDGTTVTMLETTSIETGIALPDSIFQVN